MDVAHWDPPFLPEEPKDLSALTGSIPGGDLRAGLWLLPNHTVIPEPSWQCPVPGEQGGIKDPITQFKGDWGSAQTRSALISM